MEHTQEINAWKNCALEDLWIFDKLIVSRKSGHICGPRGMDVPKPGNYFVKPISNMYGMGLFARVEYLENDTSKLHPGEFWCEIFEGEHISVDYKKYDPILSVIGEKDEKEPYKKFTKWTKTSKTHPLPQFIGLIPLRYKTLNCEFIGGKLIEIHLRNNPDFSHGNSEVIPVWKGSQIEPPNGYVFIKDDDEDEDERLGMYIR